MAVWQCPLKVLSDNSIKCSSNEKKTKKSNKNPTAPCFNNLLHTTPGVTCHFLTYLMTTI